MSSLVDAVRRGGSKPARINEGRNRSIGVPRLSPYHQTLLTHSMRQMLACFELVEKLRAGFSLSRSIANFEHAPKPIGPVAILG